MRSENCLISIVMGSQSDWEFMRPAHDFLNTMEVGHDVQVVSAHRMPDRLFEFAEEAEMRGIRAIIAGAGGAAHLPGMIAAKTIIPVLGVPMPTKYMKGLDSLYSIVQMPKGIPVATFAIGESGAINAAIFATLILSLNDRDLRLRLIDFRNCQTADASAMSRAIESEISHERE